MTPDYMKRLTYSRYLLTKAKVLQRSGNELSAAEAVLTAHDAAEMLMRVITDHVGVGPPEKFMDFWKFVKDKTGSAPPHRGAMDRFNNLRVGFKHKGNLPNSSVVGDLLPSVSSFCSECAERYLKVDYESVSLIDLIQNGEAREKMKEAEKAKAEGDFHKCFLALGVAFDNLRFDAGKRDGVGLIPQIHSGQSFDPLTAGAFQKLIDTVNMLILGI